MNIVLSWLPAQAPAGTPPTRTEQLLEWLNGNPIFGWGIAVFAVLALAVAAVAKLTGNLDKIIGFFDKYRPKRREITEEDQQRLREQLVEVVLRQVVKRLEDSLHHKIRLDLKRREERQRVGRRDLSPVEEAAPPEQFIRREINPFDSPSAPTPVGAETSTSDLLARDDINGRLLILGEPGAGKTNELLAVAKGLLQKAQQSKDEPFPVIFELSEWSSGQGKPLEDWLAEQLKEKYNVPPGVAEQWIKDGQLFPLLDGLDELRRVDDAEGLSSEEVDRQRQARQVRCMRAISTFLDTHPTTPMVVCCRRQEYEMLEAHGEYLKRLNGAIYLEALDDHQIRRYLEQLNRGLLWESLEHQPKLLSLVRSPLFLLILITVYRGQSIQNTDELLDFYIEQQLSDLNNQGAYPPGKAPSAEHTHHYLSWLATVLERQKSTEFLIENLQPSWLERKEDKKAFEIVTFFCMGLFFTFLFLLMPLFITELNVDNPQWFDFLFFRILPLLITPAAVLFAVLNEPSPEDFFSDVKDKMSFQWKKALPVGLCIGLGTALLIGIILPFSEEFFEAVIMPSSEKINEWLATEFPEVVGLVQDWHESLVGNQLPKREELTPQELIAGQIMLGIFSGVISSLWLFLRLSQSKIDERKFPNQGIKESFYKLLILGMFITLVLASVSGLAAMVVDDPIEALNVGIEFGFFFGFMSLGWPLVTVAIPHFAIRFVLHRSGVAPWNYAKFLEHAENHRFIQHVGGRYRFVHDLLRKRFAERYLPRWR